MSTIRRIITKHGVSGMEEGPEQDLEDARALAESLPFRRYFLRRLNEKHMALLQDLARQSGDSVIPYKVIQGKMDIIEEIKNLPEMDMKLLKR